MISKATLRYVSCKGRLFRQESPDQATSYIRTYQLTTSLLVWSTKAVSDKPIITIDVLWPETNLVTNQTLIGDSFNTTRALLISPPNNLFITVF